MENILEEILQINVFKRSTLLPRNKHIKEIALIWYTKNIPQKKKPVVYILKDL